MAQLKLLIPGWAAFMDANVRCRAIVIAIVTSTRTTHHTRAALRPTGRPYTRLWCCRVQRLVAITATAAIVVVVVIIVRQNHNAPVGHAAPASTTTSCLRSIPACTRG